MRFWCWGFREIVFVLHNLVFEQRRICGKCRSHYDSGLGRVGREPACNDVAAKNAPFRLVGRNPKTVAGGEVMAADLTDRDQAIRPPWPKVMANMIAACKRAQAKLFF
jgi:hypothetical protein